MSDSFEGADEQQQTSGTFPAQCSSLRKNGFVMLKGNPCKISDMSTSKTGKHGHAKVHLVGYDIFTNKRYEDLCPSTHNMYVPEVGKEDFSLLDITHDGFVSLLTADGDTKDDLKLPEGELGEEIRAAFDEGKEVVVNVQSAVGMEAIVAWKENK
eukprot:TRINITY_DN20_c0_g1_i2.p1 TRINITY_DN20_c0_g1~~TRINITY_DN20_c0_g1_i2.p1  ORF type:complete len:155 (+),score=32.91 TRINITY_DN20_c0_g1_i2:24-488(+)